MANPRGETAVAATIDAVSRFIGKSPIVSAPLSETKAISAALWQHSPQTRRFEGHECDILAVSLRGDATLEQIENGRSVWRGPAPGSIVLLRAGDPTDWHLDGPFEMLHVYLAGRHPVDVSVRSKINRPFRDPLLLQLARSASLALTESGGKANYIAPLLDSIQRCFDERFLMAESVQPQSACSGLTGFARNAVIAFVRDNLAKELRAEDLAKVAGLSAGHFSRAFKASFGLTPHQYIIEQRISFAADLLSRSELEVANIARLCGFAGASHLGCEFRKRIGVTPTHYRRIS